MDDNATGNPYKPASGASDKKSSSLTVSQAILLYFVALVLVLRGGFMLLSWAMQLSSGFEIDSHFYAATIAKDGIYGFTALIGGLMLLVRHKLGWWFSLLHWCWYVACEIFVVAAGATLGWRVPVHHDPPALYRVMGVTALMALAGLAILLWRPIATNCGAPTPKRYKVAMVAMILSAMAAFAVNGWMSMR